jgi:5-formaminoimidazole-4-carboxamide-1-beta-D-ribofuranosyl 5'-monophosphate synthetase
MDKRITAVLTGALLLAGALPSHATLKMQKGAKDAGFPAANCLYCHNEKVPAKGKVTNNERGAFLVKQKEVKKAKEVDPAWLKDFVETKK